MRRTGVWSEGEGERKAMNEQLKSGDAGKKDAVSKRHERKRESEREREREFHQLKNKGTEAI